MEAMNPEARRRAIAESLGWKAFESHHGRLYGMNLALSTSDKLVVPDYLNDLNAAGQLCAVLALKGWRCELANGLDTTWECTFWKPYSEGTKAEDVGAREGISTEEHYGCGNTLSEAICNSFLCVIGKWVEA